MGLRVAVLGATGAVGSEFVRLLDERDFPVDELVPLASARSVGKKIEFKETQVEVTECTDRSFDGLDLVLSSAGKSISRQYAPIATNKGALFVDNTSCFRMDPSVPLVVPEINSSAIGEEDRLVANPNCSTIIMALPLYPLHRAFGVKRVHATTYQAASGAGQRAMDELVEETRAVIENRHYERSVIPHQYAFNLFIHNSPMLDSGYVEEEMKMVKETRKIFGEPEFSVNAVCVRVPVLRAHSEALNIEFERPVSVEEAYEVLGSAPGVEVLEEREQNRWPMPIDATDNDPAYVGRIREDLSQPNTLDVWVVGDQIRKGAALNAIQIAEAMLGVGVG